ncbi:MAG TPA: ABC transporter substrate-binding protein, partial [Myxococcota bacterium]
MKAEPNRRLVLKGLSVGSAVLFVLKSAQTRPASKIWRIGVLSLTKRDSFTDAFLKALADLGYIEGKSYVLEPRFEAGNEGRLLIFAKQLADAQVDIILARGTQATQLAKRVTKTIPIVMTGSSDPVGSGLVASLARPGGNVTGMSIVATDLTEKRLQLIRRLVPRASRIGVLWNPSNSGNVKEFDRLKSAAERFGVRALSAEVRQAADIGPAINSLVASGADVIMTLADSILVGERNEIVKRASEAKLPGIFHLRDFVEA